MAKKDTLTKQYLGRNDIFADAFNYHLFGGKQVIRPEDLIEQDPTEVAVIRKLGRVFSDQKMRDLLKLCTIRRSSYATLVLLGMESQSMVHYAMPVRDMLYDALNYTAQVEDIRRKHMEQGDLNENAAFTSGFTKEDRLLPVITLCICFDKNKWDAPRSLHEMFGALDPQVSSYVNDYKLNLITPEDVEDFTKFTSELGLVLEMIRNADDKAQMRDIIQKREAYRSVEVSTVDMINAFTTARISTEETEGGQLDMCKAIQEMIEDGRMEGLNEGLVVGHKKGFDEGADMLARLLKLLVPGSKEFDKALNATPAQRRRMFKKYGIA